MQAQVENVAVVLVGFRASPPLAAFGVSLLTLLARTKSIGHSHMQMKLLFIEATRFTKRIQQLRAESQLWALQDLLCQDPEKGSALQGAGGLKENPHGIAGAWQAWWMPDHLPASEVGIADLLCLFISEERRSGPKCRPQKGTETNRTCHL